jgi:galactonate dehydratase
MGALKKVSAETVVPLGLGKAITDAAVFQGLLREGLIDVVRPDIGLFGISGVRRVAALAEPYYVAVAPRHDGGSLATAAAIHIAASLPNFFIQHVPVPVAEQDRAMRRELGGAAESAVYRRAMPSGKRSRNGENSGALHHSHYHR